MQAPSIPKNEKARLAALDEYQILDTPCEPSFDAITRVLASALDVPIALVSIVDADRQWFKSRYGLAAESTPRDVSFCGHVVSAEAPLIVRDAFEDERFADNPLSVGEPRVRFYAGAPLRTADGFVLGTLCAIDHEPRDLSLKHQELLSLLAGQIVALLELRRKELLLASERKTLAIHRQFFRLSSDLLCTVDDTMHFGELNPAWETVLGWSLDELRARPFPDFVHPEDLPRTLAEAERLRTESSSTINFENRYRHKEGHWIPLAWAATAEDGFLFASARDMGRHKVAEALLAESENRLRTLFQGMFEGMVLHDAQGSIMECNSGAERILGLSMDQMKGLQSVDPRWRSVHEDGTPFPGETHPAMVTLRTGVEQTDVTMGVHKPSGELTWIGINSRPLFHAGETAPYGVICTFRDITEQKQRASLAERYAKQERLVTTGTLAAGVGHEINNPLSYMLANLDFVLDQLPLLDNGLASTKVRELLDVLSEAREGAERVRRIVRGLRALAREESEPGPTNVHAVIEISLNMAMHALRNKATVEVDLQQVPPVNADESRLTQVIVNLLMNAAESFVHDDPNQNLVSVRTEEAPNQRVAIVVQDNSTGIAPDVLERIFDPFFSTKPVGQGTGLGLSISHNIIATFGGEITCETQEGEGTSFRVVLPIAALPVSLSLVPSGRLPTRGKLLIVDDDPAVLRSTARLLSTDHEVTSLTDPRDALSRICTGERFDIVLCDLMMPHLNGALLFEAIRAHDPEMASRFVFFTGGATTEEMAKFLTDSPNERLEKPLNIPNLRAIIRRFVDLRMSVSSAAQAE